MSGTLCPNCRITSLVDGECPDCGSVTYRTHGPPPRDEHGRRDMTKIRAHIAVAKRHIKQAETAKATKKWTKPDDV